jgi:hypothetical protein
MNANYEPKYELLSQNCQITKYGPISQRLELITKFKGNENQGSNLKGNENY